MLNFEKSLGEDPQTPLPHPHPPTISKSCQSPLSQPRTPTFSKSCIRPWNHDIHHNNTLIEYWESKILGKLLKQPGVLNMLNKYCKLVNVLVHYVIMYYTE